MLLLLHLKTLLRSLLLPPTGPLLLAVLGLLLLRWRPRVARVLLILGIGSLWLLSMPIVADALTALVESYPAFDPRHVGSSQAIVILGGGGQRSFAPEYQGPAADPILLERLAYGAYLADKTGLPILVTGHHIEATAMHDTLLRNFHIEPRWVEDQAYDTFQNAQYTAKLLKADHIQHIILVTHSTHMPRSVEEFTATGLDVVAAPAGVLTRREVGVYRFMPSVSGLERSFSATYEITAQPVRAFLAATHLRRH